MRFFFILLSLLPFGALAQDTTVRATPGYMGKYTGKMPCESCNYIDAELTLEYDTDTSGLFLLRDKYMGNKSIEMISVVKGEYHVVSSTLEGKPVWIVELNGDNTDEAMYYLVKSASELVPLSKERQYMDLPKDCLLKK